MVYVYGTKQIIPLADIVDTLKRQGQSEVQIKEELSKQITERVRNSYLLRDILGGKTNFYEQLQKALQENSPYDRTDLRNSIGTMPTLYPSSLYVASGVFFGSMTYLEFLRKKNPQISRRKFIGQATIATIGGGGLGKFIHNLAQDNYERELRAKEQKIKHLDEFVSRLHSSHESTPKETLYLSRRGLLTLQYQRA